jgi:adenylate kinase family enzyme
MVKLVIFGNSGSGKSTLAKTLSAQHQAAHLDLDGAPISRACARIWRRADKPCSILWPHTRVG